jgi:hypothetical protein
MPRPSYSNYHIQAYKINFTTVDKLCEILSLFSGAVDVFVLGFCTGDCCPMFPDRWPELKGRTLSVRTQVSWRIVSAGAGGSVF